MPEPVRTKQLPFSSFDSLDTVFLSETDGVPALAFIDQTQLPGRLVVKEVSSTESIVGSIKRLEVRGAPAIGVGAAIGVYVASWHAAHDGTGLRRDSAPGDPTIGETVRDICDAIAASRPTAVNLSWAVDRMRQAAMAADPADLLPRLRREALAIRDQDVSTCRAIGTHGMALIRDGDAVLTHCNAGRLCAVRYGTATAPVYAAREQGMDVSVYCDETRPLLQGARLTALELSAAGVPTTLICDNMSAAMMREGRIQAVFVGCDRVAANGDTANKIGTSMVALAAQRYGVPFYVCAPTSTIDLQTPTGNEIVIEERAPEEVTALWYEHPMAPADIEVRNPAFDVTDADLVTAFVTERGIVRPPFSENLKTIYNGCHR